MLKDSVKSVCNSFVNWAIRAACLLYQSSMSPHTLFSLTQLIDVVSIKKSHTEKLRSFYVQPSFYSFQRKAPKHHIMIGYQPPDRTYDLLYFINMLQQAITSFLMKKSFI